MVGNNSKVLIAFGSGGHKEQGLRLREYMLINKLVSDNRLYIACEDDVNLELDVLLKVKPIRDKYSKVKSLFLLLRIPISIFFFYKKIKSENINLVISPGPGISIVAAISCYFANISFIFIESWSRFETLSFSGRFCLRLCSEFLVQNIELTKINKKIKYVGKL